MTLEEHSVISPWRQLVLQLRSRLRNRAEKRRGGLALVKKWIFGAFPILDWLFHYDIKKCLVGDLISGEYIFSEWFALLPAFVFGQG